MKKTGLFMLLFAAMTMVMVSCDKDDDDNNSSSTTGGAPTFNVLFGYLGRSDLDAIMSKLEAQGYTVEFTEGVIEAEKEGIGYYNLETENGTIVSASYDMECSDAKKQLLEKMDEEKKFRNQTGLESWRGGVSINNLPWIDYNSKEELIDFLKETDFSTISEGGSHSTYSDVKTKFYFGGNKSFEYVVVLR